MTLFEAYLDGHRNRLLSDELIVVLRNITQATRQISDSLRSSSLSGLTGTTDAINIQGEIQKPLDVLSNEVMLDACRKSPAVSFAVSEDPVIFGSSQEVAKIRNAYNVEPALRAV
ncbi:hypothetical protein JNB88_09375 [Rhizobium cauense]|uniref:hypothetical protein n=1 Tax=Rhizobium cauense TaxID=1166683 RepID=UPI001C6F0AB8|nr:hypothetical protein [Rhizobium cauense]MBW9113845.1 hypothetical protein [Rhizobium cauense]